METTMLGAPYFYASFQYRQLTEKQKPYWQLKEKQALLAEMVREHAVGTLIHFWVRRLQSLDTSNKELFNLERAIKTS